MFQDNSIEVKPTIDNIIPGTQNQENVKAGTLKMRRYRQRLKNDPERYEKVLLKERARKKSEREQARLARSKSTVRLMTDREKWRTRKQNYRQRKKKQNLQ